MTSRISLRLLGLAAGLVLSILAVAVQPGEAIVFCSPNAVTTYYSDASHTTVVGRCAASCCDGCHCTGTTSAYRTIERFYCPDVVCPQTS